ncbi:MAG: hypothetical protein GX963_06785 [Bacteroidales bacterium]|nr:hypothetical protein [Bacteroidales bacterium]
MKKDNIFKEHFRIILYGIFVILLTIYLGVETFRNPDSTGNQQIVPPPVTEPDETPDPEDSVVEGQDDLVEEEIETVPEEEVEVIDTSTVFKENRPSFINDTSEIDGHKRIVSNNLYDLYLKDENLSIILRNRKTGSVLYSTVEKPDQANEQWANFSKSGVVIEYLKGTNIVYYQADMYSENPTIKVSKNSTGFVASVDYDSLGFGYELHVNLEDDVLTASIPIESIYEDSETFKIANVYVYPFMGYTKMDEVEGYMFVPDASGSLIHYKDYRGQFKQPFNQMIYGANIGIDESHVLSLFRGMNTINESMGLVMPVFGSVHTDKELGFLGIIDSGDVSARLYAYPNGAILPYNWITPSFIYRQFYNQLTSKSSGTMVIRQEKKNDFDISLQYHLIDGDEANYVGMAKVYRTYLEEKEVLKDEEIDYKIRVDFLASEVKSGLLKRQTVTMTTFDQVQSILQTLKDKGTTDVLSVIKGWQSGGPYTSLPHKNFKTDSSLGSLSDLKDTENIIFDNDLQRYNPKTNKMNSATLVKKLNKRTYVEEVFGKVYDKYYFITPEQSLQNSDKLIQEFSKNDLKNVAIEGISENLFSYLLKGDPVDRVHSTKVYKQILEQFKKSNFNLSLYAPNAVFWEYADNLLDVQVDSSNYVFTGEEVPFLEIVLKGKKAMYAPYTNFNANHDTYMLNMIEYGVYPSFILTYEPSSLLQLTNSSDLYSTYYEEYIDQIVEYDAIFSELHSKIKGATIEDHYRNGNFVEVTYSNGVKVIVNYGDSAVEYDGVVVKAMDFEVIGNER